MRKVLILVLLTVCISVSSQTPVTINVESPDISAGDTLKVDHMSLFHYHGVDKTSLFVAHVSLSQWNYLTPWLKN